MCQRDGRVRNNPLTAALEFVSITRSSTEVHSLVAERVPTSFSDIGGSWTQLVVKNFAHSKLMFVAHLRFRLLDFSFPRREQSKPGETFGRHGSS